MALKRKPFIGEILIEGEFGKYHSHEWEVYGFPEREPNICLIKDPGSPSPKLGDEENCFIWKHPEGLNTLFSHKEDAPSEEPK